MYYNLCGIHYSSVNVSETKVVLFMLAKGNNGGSKQRDSKILIEIT